MHASNSSQKNLEPPHWRGIVLILLLAAALRVLGLWHSYPFSYYGDEIHFVQRALSFGSFDFNPRWFHKPAFYMYLLSLEYGVYYVVGSIAGMWQSATEFAVAYISNPGPLYLIGRFSTTIFSLGSIWMVYKLGKDHLEHEIGLVSALLLTVSFGDVVASQNVKADVPATFFTIASSYLLLNFVTTRRSRDLMLASAIAGIGAATKYYSLVMLAPLWIGVAIVTLSDTSALKLKASALTKRLITASALFWLVYFVCSPFNFLDPLGRKTTFGWARKIGRNLGEVVGGGTAKDSGGALLHRFGNVFDEPLDYLQTLLSLDGLGPVVGTLGLVGFVYLLWRRDKRLAPFLVFPPAFAAGSFYIMSTLEVRHQLPLYPFLAIGGGSLVCFVAGRFPKRKVMVFSVFSLLLLVQPLYSIVRRGVTISRTDTRDLAKSWIEENIPAGTKLVIDEEGPVLFSTPERLAEELDRAVLASEKGQFTAHYDRYLEYKILAAKQSINYDIFEIRFPWWRRSIENRGVQYLTSDRDRDFGNPLKPVGVNTYQFYVDNGFEFAVVHSERYGPWIGPENPQAGKYPGFADFYRELFRRGLTVKEFDPEKDNRPGPIVKVVALR